MTEISKKIKPIEMESVAEKYKDFKFYLIYRISGVSLGKTTDLCRFDTEELTEAYFFDGNGQMHVWPDTEGFKACIMADDGISSHSLDRIYELAGKFRGVGYEKVCVREYLDFDEDGQSYVAYTRLAGLE